MLERRTLLTCVVLGGFAAFWLALGLGPLRLGPSEWDDALYCNHAALGSGTWYLRNRYVHIWSLALMFQWLEPRAWAASMLPVAQVIGIAVCAYFYARRVAGLACGLLALALVPLYAPLLKYLSVPHVDITLALWSMAALTFGLAARE
jgi:hypothetical protein